MPGGGVNCTFYLLAGSFENGEENGGTRTVRGRDSEEVPMGILSRACYPSSHQNNALLPFTSKSVCFISFMAHHTAPIKHLTSRLTAQSNLSLAAIAVQFSPWPLGHCLKHSCFSFGGVKQQTTCSWCSSVNKRHGGSENSPAHGPVLTALLYSEENGGATISPSHFYLKPPPPTYEY